MMRDTVYSGTGRDYRAASSGILARTLYQQSRASSDKQK
jgi:hypothetical protein